MIGGTGDIAGKNIMGKKPTSSNRIRSLPSLLGILLVIFGDPVQITGRQASGERIAGNSKEATLLLEVDGVSFELVPILAGEFLMGSGTGDSDEKPVHRVRIDESFYMGRTEVTVRQFHVFVEATGYKTEAEKGNWAASYSPAGFPIVPGRGHNWCQPGFLQIQDNPAVCISFNDAVAFCKWLSKETGEYCRLPSEAEWEYACRAGGLPDSPQNLNEIGWYRDNSTGKTHPVGQKKPNALGLYDMHGNAWEWCLDIWHNNYQGAPEDGSPWLTEDYLPRIAIRRVLRGGAWCRRGFKLSGTFRYRGTPDFRSDGTGFRIVCSATTVDHTPQIGKPAYRRPDKENLSAGGDNNTAGLVFSIQGEKFELVRISPGQFMMG
ncbi:MAG TPA: hypothetical protein DIU00_07755, partial [Phycisphaerales bacterium]|nr:hypothetical protein [Phycisphaerales bacterium]